MEFEIDICGNDILEKDYTIVVADKNNLINGFKFNEKIIKIINSRRGEGRYRYKLSRSGKSLFRVRLYCIIIYNIFKEIRKKGVNNEIELKICRDFNGHEREITSQITYFLEKKLKFKIINLIYLKLPKYSNADRYAYLMKKDRKNKMKTYITIDLETIEKYLRKK